MATYPKMYNLGSATEALIKPSRKKVKPLSPDELGNLKNVIEAKRAEQPAKVKSAEKPEVKRDKPFVFIGIPCYKTIHIRTMDSIVITMLQYHPNIDFGFRSGVFVHENQNDLVETAKMKRASHLFLVEHDNVFPSDTLEKLLELDKDVVSAPYSGRALPLEPLVYDQSKMNDELYQMSYDRWPDKPTRVYGVPTGCTLIKMSVFDKIEKPYFFFEYNKEGKMEMSQDIYFSKKVNEANMECWIRPDIEVIHIGEYSYIYKK